MKTKPLTFLLALTFLFLFPKNGQTDNTMLVEGPKNSGFDFSLLPPEKELTEVFEFDQQLENGKFICIQKTANFMNSDGSSENYKKDNVPTYVTSENGELLVSNIGTTTKYKFQHSYVFRWKEKSKLRQYLFVPIEKSMFPTTSLALLFDTPINRAPLNSPHNIFELIKTQPALGKDNKSYVRVSFFNCHLADPASKKP
jgi:hypothetical protein